MGDEVMDHGMETAAGLRGESFERAMADRKREEDLAVAAGVQLTPQTPNPRLAPRLGDCVRDTISGFEGIAVARAEYLYGCVRFQVEAQRLGENGAPIESVWFDEQRLDVAGIPVPGSSDPSGGPQSPPPAPSCPPRA
jgi:hypothetical protein